MSLADRLRAIIEAPLADAGLQDGDTHLNQAERRSRSVDAAVLIPVVARPEPGVILTRRTEALSSHAGQVAFPGGKIDPGDEGAVDAALREAEEEIALPRSRVEVIGTTDLYLTGTGFHITPVIGIVPPGIELVPEKGEVATIFEVPFDTLFDPGNYAEQHVSWGGRPRSFHEMYWEGERIWGVTAAIIMNFARRMRAVAQ